MTGEQQQCIVYSNDYKMPIEGEVVIPDEMLKSTDIKAITPVKVKGYLYNNEEEPQLVADETNMGK